MIALAENRVTITQFPPFLAENLDRVRLISCPHFLHAVRSLYASCCARFMFRRFALCLSRHSRHRTASFNIFIHFSSTIMTGMTWQSMHSVAEPSGCPSAR